jgi:hypothetical protein
MLEVKLVDRAPTLVLVFANPVAPTVETKELRKTRFSRSYPKKLLVSVDAVVKTVLNTESVVVLSCI